MVMVVLQLNNCNSNTYVEYYCNQNLTIIPFLTSHASRILLAFLQQYVRATARILSVRTFVTFRV